MNRAKQQSTSFQYNVSHQKGLGFFTQNYYLWLQHGRQ